MNKIRVKKYFYHILFFLGIFLFVFIENCSFSFVGYNQSYLSSLLGIIFYFSVFNPKLFNIFVIFLLGIVSDYLMQAPFGMQMFLFTMTFFLANFNKRVILISSFNRQWFSFLLISFIIFILGLILLKLAYGNVHSIKVLLSEYIMTVLSYPFIAWICGLINVKLGQLK